jgi:GDPmannose 4,6-dehydratase
MKTALITGINGQDGILLSKFLIKKNYRIIGIDKIKKRKKNILKVKIINTDISSKKYISKIINKYKPDEIYHLAENSIDNRKKITSINRLILSNKILFNLLDANIVNKAKFFYAASSEVFGEPTEYPQNENTAFKPRSLYGLIKVTGVHLVRYYRKYHGLFACSGFLYNHESYLRKNIFLIKEVVNQAFQIKKKRRKFFKINDPYVYRDWSDARDFVSAFWKILSYKSPDDYVVSSSKSRNVLEVMKTVCAILDLKLSDHMQIRKFKNDNKKTFLVGNNAKLKKIGWKSKITFRNMILDIINSKKK